MMRWLPGSWASALGLLIFFVTQACSSGVFELKLNSFLNPEGRDSSGSCCAGYQRVLSAGAQCSSVCRTKFRVCLKHYQANIDPNPPCTFGEVLTPVLGNNSVYFGDQIAEGFDNPIKFRFDFSWTGTFSLVVEAWHDTTEGDQTSSDLLVSRLAVQRWLDIGDAWKVEEHNTSSSSLRYEYRVRCAEHHYDPACARFCRYRDDKFGHYTCSSTGDRLCLPGWTGEYCDEAICLSGCHPQHGSCTEPNTCKCKVGWEGKYCDTCKRYPGCMHGTCQSPWQCNCLEGWGGLFCNNDLNFCTNHKPCYNGGTCFNTGQGAFTCRCPEGFTGIDCSVVQDDCDHQPCLNGGSCVSDGTNYTCVCPSGWHGRHCDTAAETCDDAPCKNGGTCHNTHDGYRCKCGPDHEGHNCDVKKNHCKNSPCLNGGSCVNHPHGYKCMCPMGFKGGQCETNIDECEAEPCLNGGTCVDGINSYRCVCVPGYVGSLCQDQVDMCLTNPCANGARCEGRLNGFVCHCLRGFTGADCSVEVDECEAHECRNGATCVDGVGRYTCLCPPGFSGRRCEREDHSITAAHIRPDADDAPLSAGQVVLVATLSTAVPLLVLVSCVVIAVMKHRRRLERRRADEEARHQNEQNTVKIAAAECKQVKKNLVDYTHRNILDFPPKKCVNKELDDCGGGGDFYVKDNAYTIERTKSINTEAYHRASMLSEKLEKDFDSIYCNPRTTLEKLSSATSLSSSSHCHDSDAMLLNQSLQKDYNTSPSVTSLPQSSSSGSSSSSSTVYVIDDHYQDGVLATEV